MSVTKIQSFGTIAGLLALTGLASPALATDAGLCRQQGDAAACQEPVSGSMSGATSALQPRYVLSDNSPRWNGALMRWHYAEANQPSWVTTDEMLTLIRTSMEKWSQVCAIRFEYAGLTSVAPTSNDGVHVIGWSYAQGFAGYTQYWWRGTEHYFTDVDIRLDPSQLSSVSQLSGLMNHELGHALGLTHSDVSTAIMFAEPYHSYVYQETIRDDDIAGCVAVYGAPPSTSVTPTTTVSTTEADCLFNWGEDTYGALLSPARPASETLAPYYFRRYQSGYLGVSANDGNLYFLGLSGNLENLGLAATWSAQARCR